VRVSEVEGIYDEPPNISNRLSALRSPIQATSSWTDPKFILDQF